MNLFIEIFKHVEIISTIVVGTIVLIYTLKKKLKDKGIAIWSNVFKGSEEIDTMLQSFVNKHEGVDMISLIICENGGGIPTATSQLKTSIISDGQISGIASYKANWQNVPVGYYYKAMLKECFMEGYFLVTNSEDLEDSIIKTAALGEGVKSFRLEHLLTKEKAWYYLVLSKKEGIVAYDYETNDHLRVLKQELIKIIK